MKDLCHSVCYFHPRVIQFTSDNLQALRVRVEDTKYLSDENGCTCGYLHYNYKNADVVRLLEDEITANGFGDVLSYFEGGTKRRLRDKAAELLSHPRNTHNQAEILALLLYTGSRVQGVFRSEMMACIQRWPHFYRLLRKAIESGHNLENVEYLYHGLHNVTAANLDDWVHFTESTSKWQVYFYLPAVTSASLDRDVALRFAVGLGGTKTKSSQYGCLLKLRAKCSRGSWTSGGGNFPGVDVSWLSKFHSEREVVLVPFAMCSPAVKASEGIMPCNYDTRELAMADLRRHIAISTENVNGVQVNIQQITLYITTLYRG